jgi:arylsulfatase A-like enzyme
LIGFFINEGKFHWNIEVEYGTLKEIFGGKSGKAVTAGGKSFRYENDNDRDLLPDEKTSNFGVEVLNRRHEDPFFLALGFMKPHTPLNAPSRFFDMFPPEKLPLPPQLPGDINDCARALIEHRPYGFLLYKLISKFGESSWRKWLQAYLACIAYVDEEIGKVLDALDKSPYRDNTIVIFTSDNGYHMGEKEYIFKESLWEESTQVPLIMRVPDGISAGQNCKIPVSHIDIYPTLLDLCGLPLEPHSKTNGCPLDGHSLKKLISNPGCIDWGGSPVALSSVRGNTGIHHSVRSVNHRYTLCQNGEEELYDHRSDPYEWHNLAGKTSEEEIRKDLRQKLLNII